MDTVIERYRLDALYEGAKSGLTYAFTLAAALQLGRMAADASLHFQHFSKGELGAIGGVGLGVMAYVMNQHGMVTISGNETQHEAIEQSKGKVVMIWNRPRHPL